MKMLLRYKRYIKIHRYVDLETGEILSPKEARTEYYEVKQTKNIKSIYNEQRRPTTYTWITSECRRKPIQGELQLRTRRETQSK